MNYIYNSKEYRQQLLERFLRYIKVWTTSDSEAADKGLIPSTDRQWDLARLLESELNTLGLSDVQVTDKCFVYGRLDGESQSDGIILLAHLDTSESVTAEHVNPIIRTDDNDTIIRTDGSTLLGGDDKSGIAAIMTMLSYLTDHPQMRHCPIEVMFTPDEETGTGIGSVPLELIRAKTGLTVDGSAEGELECECFNAAEASVTIRGKAIHPGYAKNGGLVNPLLILSELVTALPADKRPETTDGYQGYIYAESAKANPDGAELKLLLRSFYENEMAAYKSMILRTADILQNKYAAQITVNIKDQYQNMKQIIDQHPHLMSKLTEAYQAAGVKPILRPIRGGTDGARLSFMGIPTPNIFDGAHDFHSRDEWASLNEMCRAADVLINYVME
ncbi:MAG: tripeptide aminopeptidase PepT [Spirochaetales bacterium]|nr:tripeptide aminopeptidase PepT [Spirochaetales bacterium]